MARESRLYQRGTSWVFRARVPDRLREIIGKKEVHRSFGRVSHADAKRLTRLESLKTDALFAHAESRISLATDIPSSATDENLRALARAYFHQLEAAAPPIPLSPTERAERQQFNEEEAANLSRSTEDAGLQRVALGVARVAHLNVDTGSEQFPRLVEAVQRALIEHHLRDADRSALRQERPEDPLFRDLNAAHPPKQQSLSFRRAVELFKEAPERHSVAKKTRAAYEFRYNALADLVGPEKNVGEITRADLREVRDLLLKMPLNCPKRFPGMPLRRAIALAEKQQIACISPRSAQLYLDALNGLFRWLTTEELVSRNPAAGLRGRVISNEASRRSFSTAELNRLFVHPHFSGSSGQVGWLYWLPRLALLTGARFSELLALRANDIIEIDGVIAFSIAPNDERDLKTKGSKRIVPVHDDLVANGFLDYLQGINPNGPLFPDAAGPKDIINARNKEIGRKLRTVFPDKTLVFHSFRHTFKDAAQRARIPRELTAILGGWDLPGGRAAIDDYGRDPLAKVLREEINKIAFEHVKLSRKVSIENALSQGVNFEPNATNCC